MGELGYYLPDFWLPDVETFIEVKPFLPGYGSKVFKVLPTLCYLSGSNVMLCYGVPDTTDYPTYSRSSPLPESESKHFKPIPLSSLDDDEFDYFSRQLYKPVIDGRLFVVVKEELCFVTEWLESEGRLAAQMCLPHLTRLFVAILRTQ